MIIDIPDEWIKRLLNADPSMTAEDALKVYFRNRDRVNEKHFIFAIGEYALHKMGLQI